MNFLIIELIRQTEYKVPNVNFHAFILKYFLVEFEFVYCFFDPRDGHHQILRKNKYICWSREVEGTIRDPFREKKVFLVPHGRSPGWEL